MPFSSTVYRFRLAFSAQGSGRDDFRCQRLCLCVVLRGGKRQEGKDPNAPPGSPSRVSSKDDKTSTFAGQPATELDGSLKDLAGTNAVTATSNVQPPRLDRLV
jgi:hypothetical protein